MNWFDLVIIALLVIGALMGMRTGLLGVAFTALGVLVGWLLAGQFSDDLGELFSDSISSDTVVTVISYTIIIVVSAIVARMVGRILRPILNLATLGIVGMVDTLGGLVIGLIVGAIIGGAVITGMARYTYNFQLPEIPGGPVAEQIAPQLARIAETKDASEKALTGSALVPVFLNITQALPGDALGFIPSDFKVSLEILKQRLEEQGS